MTDHIPLFQTCTSIRFAHKLLTVIQISISFLLNTSEQYRYMSFSSPFPFLLLPQLPLSLCPSYTKHEHTHTHTHTHMHAHAHTHYFFLFLFCCLLALPGLFGLCLLFPYRHKNKILQTFILHTHNVLGKQNSQPATHKQQQTLIILF